MHGRNGERMRHTRIIVTHYGEPDPRSLRIDDAVQVERWRGCWGLTKHQMDLPSMVRLVTEEALSAAGALWSRLRQNVESVTSRRWWGSPSRSSSRRATDGS
jgi:hypothetical protein